MFDEYEWASIYRPALTVVRQDISALGEKAAEVLLEQIEHSSTRPLEERVFRHACRACDSGIMSEYLD